MRVHVPPRHTSHVGRPEGGRWTAEGGERRQASDLPSEPPAARRAVLKELTMADKVVDVVKALVKDSHLSKEQKKKFLADLGEKATTKTRGSK